MYKVKVKTDTGDEPVTQAEVTNFIKYDENETSELSLIDSFTAAARETLEKYLNVSLKSKTYELIFDYLAVDNYRLELPYQPLVSFTSLTEYDADGSTSDELTENNDYHLYGSDFVELYMPSINTSNYFIAEYISGYGGSGVESLPDTLKIAIMELVKYWYDREEMDGKIPGVIKAKIRAYRKQFMI